ncbi:MAG: LysR family transcriptional regulator [Spirochaetia bacterium]|nr:LysR family transcriptional regulator [Spirochaetia bacterium]
MELRRILYFIETARFCSFTKASESLGISQPALSYQISLLEQDLKEVLFDRSSKKIRLTLHGERFLQKALKLKDDYMDLMHSYRSGETLHGSYVISAGGTVSAWILPGIIKNITKTCPEVSFYVIEGDAVTTRESVLKGSADLGILTGKINEEGIISEIFISDTILPAVSKKHPLARKKKLNLSHISKEKMVMFHPESSIRRLIQEKFQLLDTNFKPDIVMELRGIESVLRSIKAGLGIGFISALSVDKEIEVLNLPSLFIKRNFYLCYRKNPGTEELVRMIKKEIPESYKPEL